MSDKPIDIRHAEMLACQRAYTLWPELVGVRPSMTPRRRSLPAAGESVAAAGVEPEEFVFTFRTQLRTPDGHTLPRIARVTVNAREGVVKETISK
jgi:hypothetical protein